MISSIWCQIRNFWLWNEGYVVFLVKVRCAKYFVPQTSNLCYSNYFYFLEIRNFFVKVRKQRRMSGAPAPKKASYAGPVLLMFEIYVFMCLKSCYSILNYPFIVPRPCKHTDWYFDTQITLFHRQVNYHVFWIIKCHRECREWLA